MAVRRVSYIVLQPTQFCNIDCKYCYLPHRSVRGNMSLGDLEAILKNIFSSCFALDKEIVFLWHAGEPLVSGLDFYKHIINRIEDLRPKDITVRHQIQTNAILINQSWCDFFKDKGWHIGVSIDGPDHVNDRFRVTRQGAGTLQKALQGVQLLRENDLQFGVISVLTRHALD